MLAWYELSHNFIFHGVMLFMKNEKPGKKVKNFFEFKARPLVRKGNTIYYGNIQNKYVVKMEILSTEKIKDLNVATKVHLEMVETSENITDTQKIVKISDKSGLYPALDIANAWLERAE